MTNLAMGANAPLSSNQFTLVVNLPQGAEIDVTALQLFAGGKVRGDGDMCFFNQPTIGGGAVSLTSQPGKAEFAFDLSKVAADVEKIVVTAALDGGKTFGGVGDVSIDTATGLHIDVANQGRNEAALILCEVYRRNDQWKLRNVSQGFNGGLRALAEHFGVEIADTPAPPAPSPSPAPSAPTLSESSVPPTRARSAAPKPAPSPAVNLSKVSLTKNERTVSLTKSDGRFGKIRVNLNWNQKKSGGFLGMGKTGIDLDLGAFVEAKNGNRTAVQALGNTFGNYAGFPFVKLLGDDRTGAVTDGEWLDINGDAWSEINRILVYAFIYQGVADWRETDGVVRILVPDQPEVEVKMNEFGSREGMCAVALLENEGGKIKVNREVTFHRGHEPMDRAYGWGLRWVAGRK